MILVTNTVPEILFSSFFFDIKTCQLPVFYQYLQHNLERLDLAFRIQYHQISENFTHLTSISLTSVVVYTTNSIKHNSFQRIECFQSNPQFFIQAYSINFQFLSPFSVLTQSVTLTLALHYFVQRTSVTYGMRYYPTVHQMLLDHLSREAEDIPKGDKYSNHIPLLIYLHYLPPKEYQYVGSIYVLESPIAHYISPLLALNKNINCYMCCQLLVLFTR